MPRRARGKKEKRASDELRVLATDIGGTGLKASVVDPSGDLMVPRQWLETPNSCPPSVMLEALADLVAPLAPHNRIAIGIPGVVRSGEVITAPHFGNKDWAGFPMAAAASERCGGPARMINDAEMQGLAVIRGKGLELMLTLGTGAGTGLFRQGALMPHLKLHPIYKKRPTTVISEMRRSRRSAGNTGTGGLRARSKFSRSCFTSTISSLAVVTRASSRSKPPPG